MPTTATIRTHADRLLAAMPGAYLGVGPGHGFPDWIETPVADGHRQVVIVAEPGADDDAPDATWMIHAATLDHDGSIEAVWTSQPVTCDPDDTETVRTAVDAMVAAERARIGA